MIYSDFLDEQELIRYAQTLNNRAKALKRQGRITADQLRHSILESAGRCQWCGRNLVGQTFEVDHILNLGLRGQNTPNNLAIACQACNRRKGDKHPARFAQELLAEGQFATPLIQHILNTYRIEAHTQRSLFGEDHTSPNTPESEDNIPPYRW